MTRAGRRRWPWVAGIGVAVVILSVVGAIAWLRSYRTTPVDVEEVVERYHEQADGDADDTVSGTSLSVAEPGSRSSGADDGVTAATQRADDEPVNTTEDAPPAPEPGVYLYETSGSERVDALGGRRHHYPDETTVTVTIDGDGCVHNRWDALDQRWDENLLCQRVDGWYLEERTTYHSFFRQSETREFTCGPDAMYVPAAIDAGTTFTSHCDTEGSGHSGESTEDVVAEVVGVETLQVGGEPVETVHIVYDVTIGGESAGAATVDRWFALDAAPLLVREVRDGGTTSDTVIGDVNYEERYEIHLQQREPIS